MMTQTQFNDMLSFQGGSAQSHIGSGLCSALGGAIIGVGGAGLSLRGYLKAMGPMGSYGIAIITAGIAVGCYINAHFNLDSPLGV